MNLAAVQRLLPSLAQLRTQVVLLSGGEPLLNPDWAPIATLLRESGMRVWLLSSGLSLAKHARRASELFDAITVSLDGTNRETYAAIRGLDAMENVCDGIRAAAALGMAPSIRVTVQRANFMQLPGFVTLAQALGARQVSFLAVDVANPHAFGRTDDFGADLGLRREDLLEFERVLERMERDFDPEFRSGFIAENPKKLRRIFEYFAALHGQGPYPAVHCNAPEFSAVIGATGKVQPCFFIAGPQHSNLRAATEHGSAGLFEVLNSEDMVSLRRAIRAGERRECGTCVCSIWRNPDAPILPQ
jgi:Fe-coproporphyrin III synthase